MIHTKVDDQVQNCRRLTQPTTRKQLKPKVGATEKRIHRPCTVRRSLNLNRVIKTSYFNFAGFLLKASCYDNRTARFGHDLELFGLPPVRETFENVRLFFGCRRKNYLRKHDTATKRQNAENLGFIK